MGKVAKRSARKLSSSRAMRNKMSGLRRKIGASLKRRVSKAVMRRIGTGKKVQGSISRRVNQFMRRSPPAVKRDIKQVLSKEIRNASPSFLKESASHDELVRRVERMMYSGANF